MPKLAFAFCFLALFAAACAQPESPSPLLVVVQSSPDGCSVSAAGRTLTDDELVVIGREARKKRQEVRLDFDRQTTPYRCIGGAIYALQQAGLNVGFVSEP